MFIGVRRNLLVCMDIWPPFNQWGVFSHSLLERKIRQCFLRLPESARFRPHGPNLSNPIRTETLRRRPYRFRPLTYSVEMFRGRGSVAILEKIPMFLTRNRQFCQFFQIRFDFRRKRKDLLKTAEAMDTFARPIVGILRPIGLGLMMDFLFRK